MKTSSKGLLFTLLVSTSLTTYAYQNSGNSGNSGNSTPVACDVIDVKITTIQLLDGSDPITVPATNASDCLGAFDGNNSLFTNPGTSTPAELGNNPGTNLGYDEDGWMNKEDYQGWWDGPGAFIDEADLLDLDGDGAVDDPGWVYVGKDEGNGFFGESSSDGSTSYDFINDLITFNNCKDAGGNAATSCVGGNAVSGNWAYNPPATNPEELTNLLGGDFFDQVAIVFKAGNAFAMYNFNIFELGLPPVLAGDFNYAFTGTWDISQVLGNHALSNISFFARDPIDATSVPEPSSWVLMLLASFFLYRQRKTKV